MNTENDKTDNGKLPMLDAENTLHPDIEKLLRYAIRGWTSLNEKSEPDHEDLVKYWLNGDCKEWIKNNCQ